MKILCGIDKLHETISHFIFLHSSFYCVLTNEISWLKCIAFVHCLKLYDNLLLFQSTSFRLCQICFSVCYHTTTHRFMYKYSYHKTIEFDTIINIMTIAFSLCILLLLFRIKTRVSILLERRLNDLDLNICIRFFFFCRITI